jgi:hypothetical protein
MSTATVAATEAPRMLADVGHVLGLFGGHQIPHTVCAAAQLPRTRRWRVPARRSKSPGIDPPRDPAARPAAHHRRGPCRAATRPFSKLLDLTAIAILTGSERTEDQFASLLTTAGFEIDRVAETPAPTRLIEARSAN